MTCYFHAKNWSKVFATANHDPENPALGTWPQAKAEAYQITGTYEVAVAEYEMGDAEHASGHIALVMEELKKSNPLYKQGSQAANWRFLCTISSRPLSRTVFFPGVVYRPVFSNGFSTRGQ
jgi:hypothetical protein